MKNNEVARLLEELADIMEMMSIEWKPVALKKAARTIENLPEQVASIYKKHGAQGLMAIPSIGKGITKMIIEIQENGTITELEELKKKVPKGLREIMTIQSVGPKKAWKLFQTLKIDTVAKLERAAKQEKIQKLPGFGEKSEEDMLVGIALFKKGQDRMLLGHAILLANNMKKQLQTIPGVKHVTIAGSIRRRRVTIKDIDILVVATKPKAVMDAFTSLPNVQRVIAKGETKSSVTLQEGKNVDLRIVPEKSYGAALNYFTGSKDHNVHLRQLALKKGWTLSEYGLFTVKDHKYLVGKTEEDIYKKLDLQYIDPELRENAGEIEQAIKKQLPKLIQYNAMQGDLHMHTTWSDGADTTKDMIEAAIKLKYEYIAITEHSKSTHVANGLDEKRLTKRLQEIDKIQKNYKNIKVFKSAEVDILPNGDLDYEAKTLKQLDLVVASIHSRFKAPKAEMTKRILKAIENKYTTIIGHPTGRLVNQRNPYDVDLDKIFQAAKDHEVALEINAQPSRLDLQDTLIKKAKEFGVKFAISTDAHAINQLLWMQLGVAQARRGWLTKEDVLNTLPQKKFEKVIAQ